jgi:hypothetical protein
MSIIGFGVGAALAYLLREREQNEAPQGSEETIMGDLYETSLSDIEPGKWIKVSTLPGKLLMLHPKTNSVLDKLAGVVWARTNYKNAEALARKLGGRVPYRSELERALRAPEAVLVDASNQPVETMGTRAAAAKHDKEARAKFGDAGDPDGSLVFFTKTWIVADEDPDHNWTVEPSSSGSGFPNIRRGPGGKLGRHAPEWGFWRKGKNCSSSEMSVIDSKGQSWCQIQANYGAHNDLHVDYSMIPSVIRDVKPGENV